MSVERILNLFASSPLYDHLTVGVTEMSGGIIIIC